MCLFYLLFVRSSFLDRHTTLTIEWQRGIIGRGTTVRAERRTSKATSVGLQILPNNPKPEPFGIQFKYIRIVFVCRVCVCVSALLFLSIYFYRYHLVLVFGLFVSTDRIVCVCSYRRSHFISRRLYAGKWVIPLNRLKEAVLFERHLTPLLFLRCFSVHSLSLVFMVNWRNIMSHSAHQFSDCR